MNILPVIVSCQKNKNYWDSILELNKSAIIFYGDPLIKKNFEYNETKRVLKLKCNDFYEGLPEKMIALIDAILEIDDFKNFTHVMKIDDHDIIRKELNIQELNKNTNPLFHYMGKRVISSNYPYHNRCWHFGKCSEKSHWKNKKYKGKYTTWADGGKGYILSFNAMKCINSVYNFTNIDTVKDYHIYEDLMIALILKKFNITPLKF